MLSIQNAYNNQAGLSPTQPCSGCGRYGITATCPGLTAYETQIPCRTRAARVFRIPWPGHHTLTISAYALGLTALVGSLSVKITGHLSLCISEARCLQTHPHPHIPTYTDRPTESLLTSRFPDAADPLSQGIPNPHMLLFACAKLSPAFDDRPVILSCTLLMNCAVVLGCTPKCPDIELCEHSIHAALGSTTQSVICRCSEYVGTTERISIKMRSRTVMPNARRIRVCLKHHTSSSLQDPKEYRPEMRCRTVTGHNGNLPDI